MIERLLEAFFRHAVLIVLPIIALPAVATAAVLSTPPQFEAQAGVWVERPTYLNYGQDDINRYLAPATVQRNQLTELMRTRSFVSAVMGSTSQGTLTNTPGNESIADEIFTRDIDIVQNGEHLLVVRARACRRPHRGVPVARVQRPSLPGPARHQLLSDTRERSRVRALAGADRPREIPQDQQRRRVRVADRRRRGGSLGSAVRRSAASCRQRPARCRFGSRLSW